MQRCWSVLVIFGASGTGKSTAAAEIGRTCGVSWLQVDDLRLTLQYSSAVLPERTEQLYFFQEDPDVWTRPTAELRAAFSNVAEIMAPAVRTVVHSHVLTGAPVVIEGDGILPALAIDPVLGPLVTNGTISFCCLGTPDENELLVNMVSRGRGIDPSIPDKHRCQAKANKAFGTWLEAEATRLGIPVVAPCPVPTLPDRILNAVSLV